MEDTLTTPNKKATTPPGAAAASPKQDEAPRKATGRNKLPAERPKSEGESQTKQSRVLTMLRHKEGATVAAIMKVTGWQAHSVRGFFAGVVRKKLKLKLASDEGSGKRVYRIGNSKRAAAGAQRGPAK
jgi:hypothetical protein